MMSFVRWTIPLPHHLIRVRFPESSNNIGVVEMMLPYVATEA